MGSYRSSGISPGSVRCQVPRGPGLVHTRVPARRAEGRRRAGKHPADMTLALAALLATGTSGQFGVDGLDVRQDRHVRGGAGGQQAEVRTELAPGRIELCGGELADIAGAGHVMSRTQ